MASRFDPFASMREAWSEQQDSRRWVIAGCPAVGLIIGFALADAGEWNTPWPALLAHQDGGDNPERDKDSTGDEAIHTGVSEREPDDQPDGRASRDDPSS